MLVMNASNTDIATGYFYPKKRHWKHVNQSVHQRGLPWGTQFQTKQNIWTEGSTFCDRNISGNEKYQCLFLKNPKDV